MKTLAIGCVVLSMLVPAASFSQGGGAGSMGGMGGMHHSQGSVTGGAFGTSPAAPGTNSAGTALSSSGTGNAVKGAALGTGNPAVDKEDAKVARMIGSICRGC
jgi:hypothetical protein